jgi:hypothetical protein
MVGVVEGTANPPDLATMHLREFADALDMRGRRKGKE